MSVEEYSAARRGIRQDLTNSSAKASPLDPPPQEETADLKVELVDIREQEQWGDTPLVTLTPSRHQAKSRNAARFDDYVLVLRRRFNKMNEKVTTELEVRSAHIQKAFRVVLGDYPSMNFDSTLVTIPKPYAPLFHYRKELREYASDSARTTVEREHLDVLIKFMDTNLARTERDFGYTEPYHMVSYPLLWTLFRPEEVIIAQGDHFDECFTVDSFEYIKKVIEDDEEDTAPCFKIHARRWDYNGTRFGISEETFRIREFSTAVKIDTLMVYPIRFHKKEDIASLQNRLIARGKKWRKILKTTHMRYNGQGSTNASDAR